MRHQMAGKRQRGTARHRREEDRTALRFGGGEGVDWIGKPKVALAPLGNLGLETEGRWSSDADQWCNCRFVNRRALGPWHYLLDMNSDGTTPEWKIRHQKKAARMKGEWPPSQVIPEKLFTPRPFPNSPKADEKETRASRHL